MQNNAREVYALLNLLFPEAFNTSSAFDEAFDLNAAGGAKVDTGKSTESSAFLVFLSFLFFLFLLLACSFPKAFRSFCFLASRSAR